jgi:hypothetical protein
MIILTETSTGAEDCIEVKLLPYFPDYDNIRSEG